MQHRLKAVARPAGAWVVAAELLDQLLAAHLAVAALDHCLATGTPCAACSSAQKLTWSSCLPMIVASSRSAQRTGRPVRVPQDCWHGGVGAEAQLVLPRDGGLEDATEQCQGQLLAGSSGWRLAVAPQRSARRCQRLRCGVLAAMGQMPGAAVSLLAALAGGAFAWRGGTGSDAYGAAKGEGTPTDG